MVPFVRTVSEAAQVLDLLKENKLQRGQDGLRIVMMCELPSNAILAEEFLEFFDGFSIGSNDLTQLTLGLDRDSGLVAAGFDERDGAVKAMLSMAIKACRKHGKYVGICGQGPSDHPDFARWLMEQGIESLSLNPDTVIATWLSLAGDAPALSATQQAALLPLPLLLALRRPLIVLELALGKRDLQFDAALGEMQVERNQRVAALLHLADQAPDLLGAEQQLAGARRIGGDVRRAPKAGG
jgi:hypothetical protein